MAKLTVDQERKLHDLRAFAAEQIAELQRPERTRGIGYVVFKYVNRRSYRDVMQSRGQRLALMQTILGVTNDVHATNTGDLGQPVSPQGH